MRIRNVLSLFDGMSCGRLALEAAGIEYDNYYASEIDSHAIDVAQANFPDTIQLGDVRNWRTWDLENIDLIIGGSPCQGFSAAGRGLNFDDPRSRLFFDMVEIIEAYQPRYRMLENVVMRPEWQNIITEYMAVGEPTFINSRLVSAQNRQRNYWANWNITEPEDQNIRLRDILETDTDWRPASIVGRRINPATGKRNDNDRSIPVVQCLQVKSDPTKAGCITTVAKDSVVSGEPPARYPDTYNRPELQWRNFTLTELERLQTLPDGYTAAASDSQRRKMIGNGWTVAVIRHVFECLRDETDQQS